MSLEALPQGLWETTLILSDRVLVNVRCAGSQLLIMMTIKYNTKRLGQILKC